MDYPLTKALREACLDNGIKYTEGMTERAEDGSLRRVDTDRATCLYNVYDETPLKSLTFVEEDGALFCADDMSIAQCIAAALAKCDES